MIFYKVIVLIFYSLFHLIYLANGNSRISDLRRCANKDCSVPISLATTLLHYTADDDRLISFPRNSKATVYSKEAGDTPNFWEVEINRKRGYAPKTFLRENKVLVKNSAVNVIVPTGRDIDTKQNSTQSNNEKNHESVIATPNLPPNSKGLFATIGGVSADSVPPNKPDINPHPSKNYEVFDGTTIYNDGSMKSNTENNAPSNGNDKPEIDQQVDKSQKSSSTKHQTNDEETKVPETEKINRISEAAEKELNAAQLDGETSGSNSDLSKEPSQINKESAEQQETGSEHVSASSEGIKNLEEEGAIRNTEKENLVKNSKAPIESSGDKPGIIDGMMKSISNLISSGSGNSNNEEDNSDDDYEEDDDDDDEGEIEDGSNIPSDKENEQEVKNKAELVEQQVSDSVEKNNDGDPIDEKEKSHDYLNSNRKEAIPELNKESSPAGISDSNKLKGKETLVTSKNANDVETSTKETNESSSAVDTENNELSSNSLNVNDTAGEYLVTSTNGKDAETLTKQTNESNSAIDTENNELSSNSLNVNDTAGEYLVTSTNGKDAETLTKQTNESSSAIDTENNELSFNSSNVDDKVKDINENAVELNQANSDKIKITIESNNLNIESNSAQDNLKKTDNELTKSLFISTNESEKEKLDSQNVVEKASVLMNLEDNDITSEKLTNSNLNDTSESEKSTHSVNPTIFSETNKDDSSYPFSDKTESVSFNIYNQPQVDRKTDTVMLKDNDISISNVEKRSPVENVLVDHVVKENEGVDQNDIKNVESIHPVPKDLSSMADLKQPDTIEQKFENTKKSFYFSPSAINTKDPKHSIAEISTPPTQESNELLSQHSELPSPPVSETSGSSMPEDSNGQDIKVVDNEVSVKENLQDLIPEEPIKDNLKEEEVVKIQYEESSSNSIPEKQEDIGVVEDLDAEDAPDETSNEISGSWYEPLINLFSFSDSTTENREEAVTEENIKEDHLLPGFIYNRDETCAADGPEGSCETLTKSPDADPAQTTSWQESIYPADMSTTLELLEKVPLDVTIWLVVTAIVVLIFSLGYYYIEAHKRDGPLVAIINKLEREVLVLKKESCILDDRLQIAQEQLEAWNANSSENDALIVELKQELEETKTMKAELEEQVAALEREVETATESGLEMHRLLSESLSSQDGSQVLLSTVESLREKLENQEIEISNLNQKLSQKNLEVEELEEKLTKSTEVVSSLEERLQSKTREMEEKSLELKDQHRQLIAQLEENMDRTKVMETKALDETRVSTELSKLRLFIEELQKTVAEKDLELEELKEVVKQVRSTDSNEKMDALFDVVSVRALFKAAAIERDDFKERFQEEEGARKLLEGHMKKISQEVAELKNSYEAAEKEKIEALTKLQVLSNYFKEKESQLQKELGLQESMWVQKQSDDHTIYEQMKSLREENEKYKVVNSEKGAAPITQPTPKLSEVKTKKKSNPKTGPLRQSNGLQNESLKKEIVDQESSFKIQLANVEQKSHENWVASRQAERRLKEVQQEAAQLRNRLTMEKNTSNYSIDESKHNISESNGDPSASPPSMLFPSTRSPPFMMYPHMPPPGDFVPPPPLMGSPYPSEGRQPPLGRISSPPLDHRFSPPPPLSYAPYEYAPPPYGHHSPSPPPPHHRNVHKPQPRELPRDQKDLSLSNYSPESDKTTRRNKR